MNPWLGLRSYQEGETIYGRTEEIASLAQCILANVQTVLYGKSGIGKTSLLNAGVFPLVRKKGVFPVNIRLEHNSEPYFAQISRAVFGSLKQLRRETLDENGDKVVSFEEGTIKERVKPIAEGKETLWEFFHRHEYFDSKGERLIPMLVFDQFEEIFTLERDSSKVRAFFSELADLLNGVIPDYICNATDDYVSKDISSDVLENGLSFDVADFNVAPGKYEEYLTTSDFHMVFSLREDFLSYLERETVKIPSLRQNRYCLQAINEEQAAIIIMNPIPGLVSKDVAKLIISKVIGDNQFDLDGIPERQVDSAILSLYLDRLYQRMISEGSSVITEDLVHRLDENIIEDFYLESIENIPTESVEYLEDHLINYDGRRENVSLTNVINIGHIKESDIQELVDKHLLRVFSYEDDLRLEYIHDILCPAIKNRRENRLIAIEQERERRQYESQAEELRRKARVASRALWGALLLIIAISIIIYCGFFMPVSRIFAETVSRYGWTYGRKPISKEEAQYRECHYVLKKKGLFRKHFTTEEVRNGYGELTTEFRWTPYTFNRFDDPDSSRVDASVVDLFNKTCQFETIPGVHGELPLQERGLDKEGNVLFCLNFRKVSEDKIISYYTDAYGFPIRFRDSTYFFIRETYDEVGHPAVIEYFDENGIPVKGQDGEFVLKRKYDKDENITELYSLDLNNNFMNDYDGYAIQESSFENGLCYETKFYNHAGELCCDKDSVYITKYKYDSHGRITHHSYWYPNGAKANNKDNYHAIEYGYNDYGETISVSYLDSLGNVITDSGRILRWTQEFDDRGRVLLGTEYYRDSVSVVQYSYNMDGDVSLYVRYRISGADTTYSFKYSNDGQKIVRSDYSTNTLTTVCLDNKKRKTSQIVTDLAGHLKETENSYPKEIIRYEDVGSTVAFTTTVYDENDRVVGSYKEYIDSVLFKKVHLDFDDSGNFIHGYSDIYSDKSFASVATRMSLNFDPSFRDSLYNDNAHYEYKYKFIYSAKPSKVKSKTLITTQIHDDDNDNGEALKVGRLSLNDRNESTYMKIKEDFCAVSELYNAHKNTYSYYDEDGALLSEEKTIMPPHYLGTIFFYDNKDWFYHAGFRGGDIYRYYDEDNQLFQLYRYDFKANDYRLVVIPINEFQEGLAYATRYITESENVHLIYSSWFMRTVDATKYPKDPAYLQGMRFGYILGLNDWFSSGNFYIDDDEIEDCFDKYKEDKKTLYIYNPESQSIETYEFGPGKIGVELGYQYVEPELRFALNSETFLLKKRLGIIE